MSEGVLLLAVGCLTGVLAGLLGAGGGFATVVLLLAAGADPQVAVGTGLVYLMVMGGWGTFVHLRLGLADRRLVAAIGLGAALGAVGGALLAEGLGDRDLTLALGLFTACVTGISLAWPQTRRPLSVPAAPPLQVAVEGVEATEVEQAEPVPQVVLGQAELSGAGAAGTVIGLLKGAFGVGAGFLIVPLMVSIGRIPRSLAVTNSLFAILVASLAGAVTHLLLGNIDGVGLAWLVPGGLFGSFVGARAAQSMSPAAVRRLFLAVMGASAIYLIALASSYR
ncbi:MAG: sulfite exporter TauE/SafE family protein [Acidimicrobiia bacterium]